MTTTVNATQTAVLGGGCFWCLEAVFDQLAGVQSAESVGNQFTNDTGYNRWADSNKLIVLYPQVDKSVLLPNPQGCWDWWGYTGPDYAYRSGLQMKAIMAMVKRLAQKP